MTGDVFRLCGCGHPMLLHDVEDMEGNDPRCCIGGCAQLECADSGPRSGESTSAALRRVKAERDEARQARDTLADLYANACSQKAALAARLAATGGERDRAIAALGAAERSHAIRSRCDADMLAEARAEMDALRTARDNLDRQLSEARSPWRRALVAPNPPTEGAPPE
jgi:hypothetical protein